MNIEKTGNLFHIQEKNIKFANSIIAFLIALIIGCFFYFNQTKNVRNIASLPSQLWQPGMLLTSFIDVGQGDGIVIITPNKKVIVIDAGPTNDGARRSNGQKIIDYLKQYDITEIDYLILTHPHADHLGGMPAILKKLKVKTFIDTGFKSTNKQYLWILNAVKEKNIEYCIPEKNEEFQFDENVFAKVLNVAHSVPEKILHANNSSLVLKLEFIKIAFLLTGDMESDVEKIVLFENQKLKADVLKLGHHGSRSSSSDEFLTAVAPKYAVAMCGKNNHFKHPHQPTLDKIKKIGAQLFRTDINGNIEFLSDGEAVKITLQNESDTENQYRYFRFGK
ncbi:MAG TPA: MBL fold metallo-hydrolase [bacterium]|nr:MBL fold metallo-hydrolase [bacterium]